MENQIHSEIFFDNVKKKNYTHESLLRGILYHTEFKKDMSSIGLDDTFSFDNEIYYDIIYGIGKSKENNENTSESIDKIIKDDSKQSRIPNTRSHESIWCRGSYGNRHYIS